MNYFLEENKLVKELFDLDEILEFQILHRIEIIRGGDYQYHCYINKEAYGTSLTPIGSLVIGIKQFKENHNA